jgi:release factor glutamine methyltransferase
LSGTDFSAETTRAEALTRLAQSFERSGLDEPGRGARLALCAAGGFSPAALIAAPEMSLGEAAGRVREFAVRRGGGEPLSRIVGKREFWGLRLTVSNEVLDPRPETETIVDAALQLFDDRRQDRLRILDLGVGSGALVCALLCEFVNARGLGVDVSPAAVAVARGNAEACGVAERAEIRVGSWTDRILDQFDLIVSNPPYIPSGDIEGLPREVRDFDPRLALDGGDDGLDAHRMILPSAPALLAAGGWLLVEIGVGQAGDVLALSAKAGFLECSIRRDLSGLARVVAARAPRPATRRRDHAGDGRFECVSALG